MRKHKEYRNGSPDEERGFYHGLAYAVGWLITSADQPSIAIDLLNQSGVSFETLRQSGAAAYDLKPIAKELGLRLTDGKPRKDTHHD